MNGGAYCTYSIPVRDDEGHEREVPCAKARVGIVLGPGLQVVLCKRHYAVVAKHVASDGSVELILDQPQGEMAAAGGDQ